MESLNTAFFVGRESILNTVHSAFGNHQMLAVAGRSGIGKTALLQEYVQRFSHQYQVIIWSHGYTPHTRSLPVCPSKTASPVSAVALNFDPGILGPA